MIRMVDQLRLQPVSLQRQRRHVTGHLQHFQVGGRWLPLQQGIHTERSQCISAGCKEGSRPFPYYLRYDYDGKA